MKIAVLFGGHSTERLVSIASGNHVIRALRAKGHQILAVDTAYGILSAEQEAKLLQDQVPEMPVGHALAPAGEPLVDLCKQLARQVELVFFALHGKLGEDGSLQAVLDVLGLPYTGSGQLASALAMNKDLTKRLLKVAGIPTPDWLMAPVSEQQVAEQIGYPCIVKPCQGGSSVGTSLVNQADQLTAALEKARQYDQQVMVEAYIKGRELTVGVLANQALAVGEMIASTAGIFDYQNKYQPGGAQEIFPAEITSQQTRQLQQTALAAHQALKLADYSRADFIWDDHGQLWCLEINTTPGLTANSLLPKSAQAAGLTFDELCEQICQLALARVKN